MKIGVVIDRLNIGGVEKIAIEEVIALRKQGQDAQLVVLREKAVVPDAFPDLLQDVPVTYLDIRLPRILRFSFQFPFFSFFSLFHLTYPVLLPFVIKTKEFDYFIVHGTYTCFSAIAIKKIRKINFSVFIWDPISFILDRVYSSSFLTPVFWLFKKVALVIDKVIIKNTDKILAGGTAHNDFFSRINPDKEIEVIYPSVHPIDKPHKKEDYVLMVTAWKRGKHPEYVVKLLKNLPGLQLKMVGKWVEPEYQKEFEQLISKNKFQDRVEIVGAVSESELSDYYANARVLLQTNEDRGFGMPALEAAGNGTTFIIPGGQGVCNLFTDKEDGFYTKEKDTETIIALLQLVMKDIKLATSLGNSAWTKVINNYSWERHAEQLIRVIENSLQVTSNL